MDKKITIWCIGLLISLLAFQVERVSAQVISNDVMYYLKIDTLGFDLGYLRMADDGVTLSVNKEKNDSAIWSIKYLPAYDLNFDANRYVLFNKTTNDTDTLRFNPPVIAEDTLAKKSVDGILKYWDHLVFNTGSINEFFTSFKVGDTEIVYNYNLTMNKDGEVMLSSDTSSLQYNPLRFSIERVAVLPDTNKFYRIVVDTLNFPDIDDYTIPWKVLSADTTSALRRDSLAVKDTLTSGNLSSWKFKVDTVINDTTFFEIRNKATDSLLIFDIPANGIDTVAYIDTLGRLKQWGIPFYIEDGGKGKLMVRDTFNNNDYYLGLKDAVVILTRDTGNIKCLKFMLAEETYKPFMPDSSIVDSAYVYKVKYLNGADSGKYIGENFNGSKILLDTVFSHIPDGQFIISQSNKYSLINRGGNINTDSLFVVCDDISGDTIPNWYTNHRTPADTFEIAPITYGNINIHIQDSSMGYKYIPPTDLGLYSYAFSYTSIDTLNRCFLGYNPSDSLATLLALGDTVKFVLEQNPTVLYGALAIADIPQLQRHAYYMYTFKDDSLYSSIQSGKLKMNTKPNRSYFYLKEDTVEGKYYFVNDIISLTKVLVDSTRHLNIVSIDSVHTHLFTIEQKDRIAPDEPDEFDYLTTLTGPLFPDGKGKGFYEFKIEDPQAMEEKWLTKNFSDYAVLGKEGESMLRAGSYTPYDLHLWVDTARGWGFNADKPSFFIVKDVDTTVASFNDFNIEGYFLHVMDSTSLASHDDYVFKEAGDEFNRANYVKAKRYSSNELLLSSEGAAQLRDSVGFAGKNEDAINEYRFYLQLTGDGDGKYYIVTEAGYGDGGRTNARGYLSVKNDTIYFGPRNKAAKVSFASSTVANEFVVLPPPAIEDENKKIIISGGSGQVSIRNAGGQSIIIYNILGQPVVKKMLHSDNESIPASRGILIVKIGTKAQKVVVK